MTANLPNGFSFGIDLATANASTDLRLLRAAIDNRLGYPLACTNAKDGSANLATTLHAVDICAHPTQAGRFALVFPDWFTFQGVALAAHVLSIQDTARAAVIAGTATALQQRLAAFPTPGPSDASWNVAPTAQQSDVPAG